MKKDNFTIVRLSTESYKKGNSFVLSKVLTTLKRKSKGFDILNDGVSDEIEDMMLIENIHELPDGEYEIVYSGLHTDFESGGTEFDGYKLIPINPTNNTQG